jgi:hypothetical protein
MDKSSPNIKALLFAVEQQACRSRFFEFVRSFWDVIIKEEPVYNWHIEYLCDELQELTKYIVAREAKPYDVIINIPPGTSKSTIVTIMWPAWIWTQDASIRIITNSYSSDLSIEHATKSRDIITSDKYRNLFPEVMLRRDKSGKESYENTVTGARYATSTGGTITGKHAHLIINDDPQNPKQADSEALREQANEHTKTLSSRKVNKKNTPTVTIMQRLHTDDVTGYLLSKKADKIRHICLPAEVTGNVQPEELIERYEDGLLDPVRLDRDMLAEAAVDLGSVKYAGQFDQSPTVAGGNIIKEEWFGKISRMDFERIRNKEPIVFFADTAYTSKAGNDPSGIIATCYIGNTLYITKAQKVLMKFPDLVRFIPLFTVSNGYGSSSSIRIEPKANGLSVIDQMREITKLNVTKTPTPTESKDTRLNAASPRVECGRVVLVIDSWNDEFVGEVCGFPNKPHDEYVDILCYAIDYHINPTSKPIDKSKIRAKIY